MKLGEALRIRSDNYAKIQELTMRAVASAVHQEGDTPEEDALELLKQIQKLHEDTLQLVIRINHTNVVSKLPSGLLIVEALAKRDYYKAVQTPYRQVSQANQGGGYRFTRSEIKQVKAVNSKDLLKKADDFAKKYRELDVEIQEANWTIDLVN